MFILVINKNIANKEYKKQIIKRQHTNPNLLNSFKTCKKLNKVIPVKNYFFIEGTSLFFCVFGKLLRYVFVRQPFHSNVKTKVFMHTHKI